MSRTYIQKSVSVTDNSQGLSSFLPHVHRKLCLTYTHKSICPTYTQKSVLVKDHTKDYLFSPSLHIYKKSVPLIDTQSFPGGQRVKNMPAMREMWVQPLGPKDPQEKGMATHATIRAWGIHGKRNPGVYCSLGNRVQIDTPERHNVWHRELTSPCPIISMAKN